MVKITKEEAEALLGKCFAKEEDGAIRFVYVEGIMILKEDEAYVDGVSCMLNEEFDSWYASNINSLDQETMKHWKEVGYREISIEEFVGYMGKLTLNMQKVGEELKAFEKEYALKHGAQGASPESGDDTHKDK